MKKESQVPKIIHLMWFSGDEYPNDIKICLDTQHKVLPEYEIKVWTKEMALECDLDKRNYAIHCINHSWQSDSFKFRLKQMLKSPVRKLLGMDVKSLAKEK